MTVPNCYDYLANLFGTEVVNGEVRPILMDGPDDYVPVEKLKVPGLLYNISGMTILAPLGWE